MRLDLKVLCLGLPLATTMALATPVALATTVALAGSPTAPAFTAEERSIVERNELLARAVTVDPWMVRRWLDKRAAHTASGHAGARAPTPPKGFDPARNPDIAMTERGSAEATYDLIRLIKKAAPPATKTP